MQKTRQTGPLGYALNVFPYETLADLWSCLQNDVLSIKQTAFPHEPFPIELRLSERLLCELHEDCGQVAKLKYFFDSHDLLLITVNAFVMPSFHGQRVKERVFFPAWHESEERVRFTNGCLDLLAQLGSYEAESLSVSVPFGALKPVTMDAVAPNILQCAEHAAAVQQQTGVRCVVALEPEPGLCVETTEEAVEFFQRFVPPTMRQQISVNFDLSHQLVQFEDLNVSLALLENNQIPVAKIHVSNAAELTPRQITERPFYEDSIYLHQICGVSAQGDRAYFSLDWPTSPPPPDITRFRVHYHLPVYPVSANGPEAGDSHLVTTLGEVETFLTTALPQARTQAPLIIETYTWPEHLRGRGQLVGNICRELAWVRQKICLRGR